MKNVEEIIPVIAWYLHQLFCYTSLLQLTHLQTPFPGNRKKPRVIKTTASKTSRNIQKQSDKHREDVQRSHSHSPLFQFQPTLRNHGPLFNRISLEKFYTQNAKIIEHPITWNFSTTMWGLLVEVCKEELMALGSRLQSPNTSLQQFKVDNFTLYHTVYGTIAHIIYKFSLFARRL